MRAGHFPRQYVLPDRSGKDCGGRGGTAYGVPTAAAGSSAEKFMKMKSLEVVAAVICDADGRIFATQRGYGPFKDKWEFPGGKVEAGESRAQALSREIREEFDTDIEVGELIRTVECDYPGFHLIMHCFWCRILSGPLLLKEHEAARWLPAESLPALDWLPADFAILEDILSAFPAAPAADTPAS